MFSMKLYEAVLEALKLIIISAATTSIKAFFKVKNGFFTLYVILAWFIIKGIFILFWTPIDKYSRKKKFYVQDSKWPWFYVGEICGITWNNYTLYCIFLMPGHHEILKKMQRSTLFVKLGLFLQKLLERDSYRRRRVLSEYMQQKSSVMWYGENINRISEYPFKICPWI